MKLVVGLGNPGARYDNTRHNIGFAVLDYLAAGPSVSSWRSKFEANVAEFVDGIEQVLLIKPQTFMNLSGRSVRAAVDFYKVELSDLIVVCDDIALPLGKLRVRARGSHGGQNGLRNIQDALATQEFARLRIGIDPPGEHLDAADYVLSRWKPSERPVAEEAIAKAAQAVLLWARRGIDACMNEVNGEPKPAKPRKNKPAKKDQETDKKPNSDNAAEPQKPQ